MSKKAGCLVGLALALSAYGGWVCYPGSRYEAAAQANLQISTDRFEQEQKLAGNAATNAYLDPLFLPFWGRKGEHQPNSVVFEKLTAVLSWCDLARAGDTHLEAAVKARDPKAMAPFVALGELYPKIHEVLNKPDFLVPYEKPPDLARLEPNSPALTMLARSCSGYAEFLVLTRQSDAALQVGTDLLRYGWLLGRQQGDFSVTFLSMAAHTIGQITTAMVLQTGQPEISREALLRLSQVLEETKPQPVAERWSNIVANELYYGLNNLNQLGRLRVDGEVLGDGSQWIPGLASREIRLYKNDLLPMLESGQDTGSLALQDSPRGDWLIGRHSILSQVSVPSMIKVRGNYHVIEKRQAFLHLYVQLLLARQAGGRWPDSLLEIKVTGLNLAQVHYSTRGQTMKLVYEFNAEELKQLERSPNALTVPGMEKWEILELHRPGWVMREPSTP